MKWFIPGVSWSGSVLHRAEVIPSPCTPPLPPGSELWGRRSPHSPSHGRMPSSPARDGTVLPCSSTHQQCPRCMPLEDRHCKITGDCSFLKCRFSVLYYLPIPFICLEFCHTDIRNTKRLITVTFRYPKIRKKKEKK